MFVAIAYVASVGIFASLDQTSREWLQKVRAHERYVAALSHDFGTPISALQMAAKQLEAHLGASQRSAAEEAVVRPLFAGMEAALEVMGA